MTPIDALVPIGVGSPRQRAFRARPHDRDLAVVRIRSVSLDAHPHLVKIVALGSLAAVVLAVFGRPPVSVHGPVHDIGVMDPLCGMTRAVRFIARGDLAVASRAPVYALLALPNGALWVNQQLHASPLR